MAKTTRGPSMHDVAARAGVSHQTVSRVLNGHHSLRPETRDRVLEAIAALGYRRNLAARALVTGRTQTIGMVGPDSAEIGPLSTLHAIEKAAREAGLSTLMTSAEPSREQMVESVEFMMGRGIDALAVVAQQVGITAAIDELNLDVPVVHLLAGDQDVSTFATVDQKAGVRLAMDHLRELGHTRIQHISGPATHGEARSRRAAFENYVAQAGLEVLPVLDGDWTSDSGYEAGKLIDPSATAIFSANDQMAFGVIHALSEAGVRVPHDVSLVGFDNTAEARHCLPPLTTVVQDFGAVGQAAVDLIGGLLQGHDVEPVLVAPSLELRESTAAPRA
ncbi:LacI family transcriptional regulator [Demequina sp. B12]|uniref:LacI family DNA-binding transcriptional regulator n=1 Tax=Demequina sp. B12 TaxID=2992757 RepID=UPI00237A9903|nr:LacI family DNA-binding transcriptional regulator [Demequina sp. B12]MDE0571921.1 LacI family transcriptional regulator [Demequina sp. B12]